MGITVWRSSGILFGVNPRSERPNMADYGVPIDLEGALPWGWAAERLAPCRNFWVTTVDPRHRPHSMPVWGVWSEDDQRFFFSCAPSSLKARNLAENPNVVVAIDDTVEVVSVEGVATPSPPRWLPVRMPTGTSPPMLRSTRTTSAPKPPAGPGIRQDRELADTPRVQPGIWLSAAVPTAGQNPFAAVLRLNTTQWS